MINPVGRNWNYDPWIRSYRAAKFDFFKFLIKFRDALESVRLVGLRFFFKLVSNEFIFIVVCCVTQINFVPHIYLWQKTCSFTISSQTEVNRAKTNIKNGLKSTYIIEQLFINTKDMWHNLGKDDHNRLTLMKKG